MVLGGDREERSAKTADSRNIADSICRPRRNIRSNSSCCFTPNGPPPDRPDLAIYSQGEQFANGNTPTWDSPDILTNFWNPFRLMPESQVTIRNLSPTATAANTQVFFYTATFGIGQPRTLLGSQIMTLGPSQQVTLTFPLPQTVLNASEQRIAVHAKIVHPYDAKPINNEGAQLLADAYTSQSGRSFTMNFPVVNPIAANQQITLAVLSNQVSASVSPASNVFGPLQQLTGVLTVHVPNTIHGSPAAPVRCDVTVVGRDAAGKLLDGLTCVVWVDN